MRRSRPSALGASDRVPLAWLLSAGGFVPGPAALDIERVDAPRRRRGTGRRSARRSGARRATTRAIQSAMSAETWVSRRGAVVAELVEEHVQGGVVAARAGPHQPAAVVVDDHDRDSGARACRRSRRSRSGAARRAGRRAASTSALTRATIEPTVRHATRNSCPVADFEVRTANHAAMSSKSRVWPAPWRAHGTAATVGPCVRQRTRGRVGLDEHLRRARVQRPPPTPTVALVIAGRAALAPSAPTPGLRVRPHRHDHRPVRFVDLHALDDRARQPARPRPYPCVLHPVSDPDVSSLRQRET